MNVLEREEELARDPLAARLARIGAPPVPAPLVRRVLAREHVPRPPRRPRARVMYCGRGGPGGGDRAHRYDDAHTVVRR